MISDLVQNASMVEFLLSVILFLNMGIFGYLWNRNRNLEEQIQKNKERVQKLYYRIFGINGDDETDEGHLVETENEFQRLHNRIDTIEDKVDVIMNKHQLDVEEIRDMMDERDEEPYRKRKF